MPGFLGDAYVDARSCFSSVSRPGRIKTGQTYSLILQYVVFNFV
jgi:hypothetical protein